MAKFTWLQIRTDEEKVKVLTKQLTLLKSIGFEPVWGGTGFVQWRRNYFGIEIMILTDPLKMPTFEKLTKAIIHQTIYKTERKVWDRMSEIRIIQS